MVFVFSTSACSQCKGESQVLLSLLDLIIWGVDAVPWLVPHGVNWIFKVADGSQEQVIYLTGVKAWLSAFGPPYAICLCEDASPHWELPVPRTLATYSLAKLYWILQRGGLTEGRSSHPLGTQILVRLCNFVKLTSLYGFPSLEKAHIYEFSLLKVPLSQTNLLRSSAHGHLLVPPDLDHLMPLPTFSLIIQGQVFFSHGPTML